MRHTATGAVGNSCHRAAATIYAIHCAGYNPYLCGLTSDFKTPLISRRASVKKYF